ncbi:MAG: hypothetical protein AUJ02_04170 [Chloroflexi bacterium 13_1_40CM_3_65_12]|nr:MAG: hypothetical protein AUH40_02745 [Chloroflexi bacterium 13_1_40CM_65_17]OLC67357.1 MAG: hypothetical protein AUH69_04540 [Actinobacteria bacterium 13_1_40CM_4_65_12]OLD25793.1 MAG: hypothetical protein AUJ02_04170 [Chloroflexi bacterium 13_1_40CM_3_65_12]OLD50862.1 MAG: hypothetical protein AUI42_01375 [Actinobacteria bacterium 13_1_40CM_2_65_8]
MTNLLLHALPGVLLASRLITGTVLVVAGIAKVRVGHVAVAKSVVAFGVLPIALARVWARILPWVEVGLGFWLFTGLFTSVAAMAAAMLMVLITGAVARALIRGRIVPCGCFGHASELLSWRVVARNAVVIAALAGLAIGGYI